METLVVADAKMAEFHGSGLKRYLLTVLAATAKAFTHPSIRNPVSLVVTRLVVLGPGEGPQVGPSAAQTLRSFCAWQRGLNSANDSDPEHFDTAILFTRQVRGRASVLAGARGASRPRPGCSGLSASLPSGPMWGVHL